MTSRVRASLLVSALGRALSACASDATTSGAIGVTGAVEVE
jgi:hypothetical protein